MQSAEEIEMQLWEYIDNVCDDSTRLRITQLIATDNTWKQKYTELTAFNSNLQQLEPEHTSMRFSKNVMEAIAGAHVAQPTKNYINKWVVRSIAAVFILLIGFALVYTLQNLQWSNESTTKKVDYSSIFNSNFVLYVVLANVLVGMVLIEKLLFRKKKTAN